MLACAPVLIRDPAALRGRWREAFGCGRLKAELGCGFGRFALTVARREPETFLLGVEKVPSVLVAAAEQALAAGQPNLRFVAAQAEELAAWFAPGELDTVYLNFSDPWPKERHAKRRLTSAAHLALYAQVLVPQGSLEFKTDNAALFSWSLEQLGEAGWRIAEYTEDLHKDGLAGAVTDYELKFHARGLPIRFVRALPPPPASGPEGSPAAETDA